MLNKQKQKHNIFNKISITLNIFEHYMINIKSNEYLLYDRYKV